MSLTWIQKRAMVSNQVLTEIDSQAFCHSNFIYLEKDATIITKDGYKTYAWKGAYNEFGHAVVTLNTSGWTNEPINYTYDSTKPYVMICVMKDGTEIVTAEEASRAVSIYYMTPSPFEIKNNLVLSDEITYSVSLTANTFISTLTNIIVHTSSDYSTTSLIDVKAGTIVYVPYVAVSNVVSVVSSFISYSNGFYKSLVNRSSFSNDNDIYYIINEDCQIAFSGPTSYLNSIKLYKSNLLYTVDDMIEKSANVLSMMPIASKGQILYYGDTKVNSNYIVNAVSYSDGIIIACRSNGKVVRIGYSGTEEELLSLSGTNMDWRLCWMDSNDNVFVSPHASSGTMQMSDRGLYKLTKGGNSFVKVISLYDTSSTVTTETEENNDTIWTMCEDDDGNLYAGVYAHTIRENPAIYKSTDGGNTWTYFYNFNTAGTTVNGMHIHSIIYSKWQKALYCIVGEINTIFKSTDGASTWINLNIILTEKGSAMLATEYGIFVGSDGARNCDIDVLFNDDITHKKVFRGFANTVFAIRQSDITGYLYAFTKVDSSVNSKNQAGYNYYFPPNSVFSADNIWTAIAEWKTHISQSQYDEWYTYYQSVVDEYPDDAIRPKHSMILISRDGGKNWEVLKSFELEINNQTGDTYIDGFWTTGWFMNGECLTGKRTNQVASNPIVISEGKHKYVSGGCNLDGEIFVRTNSSSTVTCI